MDGIASTVNRASNKLVPIRIEPPHVLDRIPEAHYETKQWFFRYSCGRGLVQKMMDDE
jgi:hypothetical protein